MFAKVSWIAVTTIALFCVYTSAQVVKQVCIGCMCEVISGCNTTVGCTGDICGPFFITWDYWSDAGKPTLNGEGLSSNAFPRCVNDPYCAAATIQSYMAKFGHDCTNDGVLDCNDFLRIHRLGVNGCTGELSPSVDSRLKLCLQNFQSNE